ncbi:helix-turn-helix transcriptional regulator [Paenibacillus thiaminolyticus]|uniref:helix-turn-helix domain-containing protein n=1 Tax=Paenibacillus thiaminolyticus TaxID=49283 RepID=UPI0035A65C9F
MKAFREHNLSQVEFLIVFGISHSNLSEIEKGNSKPSADTLLALTQQITGTLIPIKDIEYFMVYLPSRRTVYCL